MKQKKKYLKISLLFIFVICLFCSCFVFFKNKDNKVIAEEKDGLNYIELLDSYKNFSSDYNNELLPSSYCMRDEYMLYTQQQSIMGLCWAFTSQTALETTIMKATGEYLDFSEAWISTALTYGDKYGKVPDYDILFSDSYVNGDGGIFLGYDAVVRQYGVVLEQDFVYEDVYEITNNNVDEYFNLYKEYANTDFRNNLIAGRFDNFSTSSNKTTIMNSMKNHIYKHGSIYCGMDFDDISSGTYNSNEVFYKTPSVSTNSGHAVSLIGWDDNIIISHNNISYKGAFIALNSWGNRSVSDSGNEGIIYILYGDSDYNSSFWGYKYEDDVSASVDYDDEIESSSASYTTTLKNAYHGTFNPTTYDTEQKNIFFNQQDINITYKYEITEGSKVKDISIYKNRTLVTSKFEVDHKDHLKTINITGSNVKTGRYKVVITYDNGGTEKYSHINEFYVCDGLEVNYAYAYSNDTGYQIVKNNGIYQLYNSYNVEEEYFSYATSVTSGKMTIVIVFATYSEISQVKMDGRTYYSETSSYLKEHCIVYTINYDTTKKSEYDIELTSKSGIKKTTKLKLVNLPTEDASNNILAKVNYETNGGDNSINSKKVVVNKTSNAFIYAPTKQGFEFAGWYYSKDLNESSKLSSGDLGKYILDYSKVLIQKSPTTSLGSYFTNYWGQFNTVFVYAKWVNITPYTVKFETFGGTEIDNISVMYGNKITSPNTSKLGFNFVGWYKDPSFNNIWNFDTDTITKDTTLYAKYTLKNLSNLNISTSSSIIVGQQFEITVSFEHEIKNQLTITYKWYRNSSLMGTNNINTYNDIVNDDKNYLYKAVVTAKYENYVVTQTTDEIEIKGVYNLNHITISHLNNFDFVINDTDTYQSLYTINVYINSSLLKSFTQYEKAINIKQYVNSAGLFSIGVIKSFAGQTLSEVRSQEIEVYSVGFSGVEGFSPLYEVKGYLINSLTAPTKTGFEFNGWKVDNNTCQFPYTINKNTEFVATWKLKSISNSTISALSSQYVGESFDITLEFDHELKNFANLSVEWYKNSSLIETNSYLVFRQTLSASGDFSYYAILTLEVDGYTTTVKTNIIYINATYNLNPVQISYEDYGKFNIIDTDNYNSLYNVKLYFDGEVIYNSQIQEKQIDLSSYIVSKGKYKLSVIKSFDNQILAEVSSNEIEFVELVLIKNISNSSEISKSLKVKNSNIAELPNISMQGYTFNGWYLDSDNKNLCSFPISISGDLTLYAKLSLNSLTIENLADVNFEYDKTTHNVNLNVSHELLGGNYSYNWKKVGDNNFQNNQDKLELKYVRDSGEYYCQITYNYNGDVVENNSNIFKVNIEKATTNIDTSNIQKEYTYDGLEHVISSGAILDRVDESVSLNYTNNSFKNVPTGNILKLKIEAEETDNYKKISIVVDIRINKAQSVLSLNNYQTFTYSKTYIEPNYEINNSEQNIVFYTSLISSQTYNSTFSNHFAQNQSKPIDAGEYNVLVRAEESVNYLASEKTIKVKVNPAEIKVKVEDLTSIWLFDLKEFSYTVIEGEIFEGDSLNEIYVCDAKNTVMGEKEITMIVENSNYSVEILKGVYVVTGVPYYALAGCILFVILLMAVVSFKKKQKIKNMAMANIKIVNLKQQDIQATKEVKSSKQKLKTKQIEEIMANMKVDKLEDYKKPSNNQNSSMVKSVEKPKLPPKPPMPNLNLPPKPPRKN